MFRVLALAITLMWLVTSAAAACEPPPDDETSGATGGPRALRPAAQGTPAAAECAVEPRSVAGIEEITNSFPGPVATPLSDLPVLTESDLPEGEPPDAETLAAITAALDEFVACGNSGDLLRLFAFFSDDFIASHPEDFAGELTGGAPTPEPTSEEERVFVGEISRAVQLPDGRVALVATIGPASESGATAPYFFVFVQERGHWVIDDFALVSLDEIGTPTAGTWQPVQGEGYAGVIVPEADGAFFFRSLDGTERAGYWTPTATEIDRLESDLSFFLLPPPCGESPAPDQIWQELETYHRQYAGYVTDDGRRLILVNAFCDDTGLDWRSQPVAVLDGGACFFQITYDPAGGDFFDLQVNGEA